MHPAISRRFFNTDRTELLMNKSSLSRALFLAGAVALAGAAQAGSFTGSGETGMTPTTTMGAGHGAQHHSAATSTGAGETGLTGSSGVDTQSMGAGPNTTYYAYPQSHLWPERRGGATATFNTPGRAGEASTMTNGVPNQETSNPSAPVTGSVIVPYTVTN
jgi:hypothetical protein